MDAAKALGRTRRYFGFDPKPDELPNPSATFLSSFLSLPRGAALPSPARQQQRGLPGSGSLGAAEAPAGAAVGAAAQLHSCLFGGAARTSRQPRCLKLTILLLTLALLLVARSGEEAGGARREVGAGGGAASAAPSTRGAAAALAGPAPPAVDDAALARAYGASWLQEPPADPAHCLGQRAFPKETPSYGVSVATNRKYVMPNCEGGIGNQVFCAAAALAYALEFGRCLVVSKIFVHPSSAGAVSYRDTVFRHLWVEPALRPTPQGRECSLPDGKACPVKDALAEVVQPGLSMHWEPFTAPRYAEYWVAVLMGGWQHFWYTWRWRAQLAAYLRPSPAVVRALLQKYPDLINGVALHFRRGDFIKSLPQYKYVNRDFPTASDFYYAQALDLLLANVTAAGGAPPVFFIFTNDYEWARSSAFVAALPGRVVLPDTEDEVYTWYMMMLARRGIVCPNSTFCWWAAYIGVLQRFITLPNHWYNSPGQEPTGIHFPGATVVHSDAARGEGHMPWYPRPWDASDPEAGVVPQPWPSPEPIPYPLPHSYWTKKPTHSFVDEASLF
jgi:hypothetical protein